MSVLEEWWDDLKAHAIPPDASDKQVRDMRIAFLIGVRETLVFVIEHDGSPERERQMDDLLGELNLALSEIVRGLQ